MKPPIVAIASIWAALAATHLHGASPSAPGAGATTQSLDWAGLIQKPPDHAPETKLRPLLVTREGRPIETEAQWRKRRAEILAQWKKILGRPPLRCPLRPRLGRPIDKGFYILRRVELQVEPGEWMPAWFFVPKGKGRWPAVVEMHPTRDENMDYSLGDGTAIDLVERGYVVIAPRNFLWGYRGLKWKEATSQLLRRYPCWTGMGKMLWDGQRAIDYLETLPFVRGDRIGAIGHSLGAKEVLYMAAFDPRVKAAVFSEGGIGLKFSNWDAQWYLGPKIRAGDFGHDHHELLALIAPRGFLLLGGDSADGERSWPYIQAVLPVWRMLGRPDAVGMFNHRRGHRFPEQARRLSYRFLDRFLKHQEKSAGDG